MPDGYGFNHLGGRSEIEVRCIEEGCMMGGPLHKWPVRLRAAHWRMHERERRRAAQRHAAKRQREATARLRAVNRLRQETR